MARDQSSMPKSVELSMDECKVVVKALFNYRAVLGRAKKTNDDPVIQEAYDRQIREVDNLGAKF